MLALALFSVEVLAAPFEVETLWVRGSNGAWVEAQTTGLTWRVGPNGDDIPLRKGDLLPADAELATGQARVALRCIEGGKQIEVLPDSHLILQEWGIVQELAAAWYNLIGDFYVVLIRYEAVVDGTGFTAIIQTDARSAGAARHGKSSGNTQGHQHG